MRYIFSLLMASMFLSGAAYAQADQVQRGPLPAWVDQTGLMAVPADASGMLFVRRSDILVRLDAKGQEQYMGYRIKILHPNALQIGNLAISWNPESGAPTIHALKIYRGQQVLDILPSAKFEILRREGQLEAAMLDGTLTAVTQVADLRVGDELEFSYTTRSDDSTLGDDNAGLLLLDPNAPPGRFRLGLKWIEGQKPEIKMTEDMAPAATEGQQSVDFRFDNPPNLTPPKDAPPRYNWQRIVEYSDFSVWEDISAHFAGLYREAASFPVASPLQQEVNLIAAAHADPFERASAALKLVQQNVRYIYVGLDGGNLRPASAEETWQRRYGDCKGKTALLLGLLAKLGIEAEAVLANNAGGDDGLDQRLPNPGMFNHVLVRARIDGQLYYLDGTLPPVVRPGSDPVLPYRWILPLKIPGSSIERLEWYPATVPDDINLFEIDARKGFDLPAHKTSTSIVRGIKGLEQQVQFSVLTPGQLLSGFRQQAVGDTWQTIDDVQWKYDEEAQASVLTISGTGMVDWEDDGDGARSLALPGGGFIPPSKRIRAAGDDEQLPYFNNPEFACYVTTVRLPSNTDASHWSTKGGFDTRIFGKNYYRVFETRDDSIRMIRGSRVEQQEIDAASAKRDNDRIASFDNSKGWIFYDPSDENPVGDHGKRVPATYDIDWTTDSSACLSSTASD
jgi:transglutaminase-like putative cysteine protease